MRALQHYHDLPTERQAVLVAKWHATGQRDYQIIPGVNDAEPMYVDNTPHPANARLALAKALPSRLHAFGLDWEDDSGRNNGPFAPFDWRGG